MKKSDVLYEFDRVISEWERELAIEKEDLKEREQDLKDDLEVIEYKKKMLREVKRMLKLSSSPLAFAESFTGWYFEFVESLLDSKDSFSDPDNHHLNEFISWSLDRILKVALSDEKWEKDPLVIVDQFNNHALLMGSNNSCPKRFIIIESYDPHTKYCGYEENYQEFSEALEDWEQLKKKD